MTQPTTPANTKPTRCLIVPDLFGFTIHLNGAGMYVLNEHLDDLLLALASHQESQDRAQLAASQYTNPAPAWLQEAQRERTAGE